jgi:hypothetical protein
MSLLLWGLRVNTTEGCALGLRTGNRLRQGVAFFALSSQLLTRELLGKTTNEREKLVRMAEMISRYEAEVKQ